MSIPMKLIEEAEGENDEELLAFIELVTNRYITCDPVMTRIRGNAILSILENNCNNACVKAIVGHNSKIEDKVFTIDDDTLLLVLHERDKSKLATVEVFLNKIIEIGSNLLLPPQMHNLTLYIPKHDTHPVNGLILLNQYRKYLSLMGYKYFTGNRGVLFGSRKVKRSVVSEIVLDMRVIMEQIHKIEKDNRRETNVELLAISAAFAKEESEILVEKLINFGFDENDVVEAVKSCRDFDRAEAFLSRECHICFSKYPTSKMVSMLNCTHEMCRECTTKYFTTQILSVSIKNVVCPSCFEPKDLDNEDVFENYFAQLDILLRGMVSDDVHDVFQKKVRDEGLQRLSGFQWCTECESGYIVEDLDMKREMCPNCKAVTCASCKKKWEKEHEGKTCEEYATLQKHDLDNAIITSAIERELMENGICCPKCKFTYSLAKGGCMHFVCGQCQHEFCNGCNCQYFRTSMECGDADHDNLGLHAHHPKNCLFHLRDKDPEFLQNELRIQGIKYEIKNFHGNKFCPVEEQKEQDGGFVDAPCGRNVEENYAGLCRMRGKAIMSILENYCKNACIKVIIEHINSKIEDKVFTIDYDTLSLALRERDKSKMVTATNFLQKIIEIGSNLLLPPQMRNLKLYTYEHDRNSDTGLIMFNQYRKYLSLMGFVYFTGTISVLKFCSGKVKRSVVSEIVLDMRVLMEQMHKNAKDNLHETEESGDLVKKLLKLGFDEKDVAEAVKCCHDFDMAKAYLTRECHICFSNYPISKVVSMLNCSHEMCRECSTKYFTAQIKSMRIKSLVCPCCFEPKDLDNEDVFQNYFAQLDILA